jgi:hypothetical protein
MCWSLNAPNGPPQIELAAWAVAATSDRVAKTGAELKGASVSRSVLQQGSRLEPKLSQIGYHSSELQWQAQ